MDVEELREKLKQQNGKLIFGLRKCHRKYEEVLFRAIQCNEKTFVRELLTQHNFDLRTPEGSDMLWRAVLKGHPEIASMLVRAGVDPNARRLEDERKLSFLHCLLIETDDPRISQLAQLLIRYGADVNALDARGNSVLLYAVVQGSALIKDLLERGARVDVANNNGMDILFVASCQASASKLLPMLVQHGTNGDLDRRNRRAIRAIEHMIYGTTDLDTIRMLLDLDVPIDLPTINGFTLLQAAVSREKIDVVELLLARGADVHKKSSSGMLPLYIASSLKLSYVAELLIKQGATIHNCNDDGQYPIHAACRNSSVQNINLYLRMGANVSVVDKNGRTPLSVMVKSATTARRLIVKHLAVLISKGMDIGVEDHAIIHEHHKTLEFFEQCLSELQKMKETKIYNDIPFYCFFSKNTRELSALTRNIDLYKNFKQDSAKLSKLFPLYYQQIFDIFSRATEEKSILNAEQEFLSEIFHDILPYLVIKKIAYYSCLDNLKRARQDFYSTYPKLIYYKKLNIN
ncbi:ankyrin-1-like [Phymastichus coffea]|uniref:ankyrin-1-like n=1 Tax=Phymastichus coffea TaxID=108790 RepID=UPI00273B1D01|nr:ankyrin-1-like [Phymastichus coffea]